MRFRILQRKKFAGVQPYPGIHLYASDGTHAFYSSPLNSQLTEYVPGEYIAECEIPANLLNSGTYFVGLGFSDNERGVKIHFFDPNALCFHVTEKLADPEWLYDMRNGFGGIIPGVVRPRLNWSVRAE